MPKLIYKDPDTGSQVVVDIDEEMSEVTVGRNPGNIIRINNPSVSRRHTKFLFEHGRVTLYDLNSSNGTYVNGMRIQEHVLEDGDLVRVGEFPLEFVDEPEPVNTQVDDGQIVEAATGGMKSTHMGVGAMGMGDDDDRGGAMATGGGVQHHQSPDSGIGIQESGTDKGLKVPDDEPEEFVLGEDDIEEVVESEPVEHVGFDGDHDDQTIEAAVDMAVAVQNQSDGGFDGTQDVNDDAQTRRADGDALVSQLQEAMDEGTIAEGDGAEVLEELRDQVRTLRAELEKAPDRHQLQQLESERDEQRRRADELESQLAGKDDEIQQLRDELSRRDDDVTQLEEAVQRLEQNLSGRDDLVAELEQQLEQARADAGGGDDEALRAELQEKQQQIDELQQQIDAFDEEREKKKAIFKELSGDLKSLVGKNKELTGEVKQLTEELDVVKTERDSLLETIDQIEDAGTAASAGSDQALQELREEKTSLEETLAEVILERDRLEDQLRQERDGS